MDIKNKITNKSTKILGYADDIDLVERTTSSVASEAGKRSYVERIENERSYGKCKQEVRSVEFPGDYEYSKPHSSIHIPGMKYNDANDDEILRTVIYFRGQADFSVVLSKDPQPDGEAPFFQSVLAHTNGETSSVFLESFTNISDDLPSCDEIQDIPNMFDKVYYEKLTLIVKKEGTLYWYIPGRSAPLLTCKNDGLKDVEYISFSGFDERSADVYYADCPNA
uniref:Uncharacterized protein n=1 Tax=Megaselia scalaris TaxID=36166 RepID=T1GV83_MEGSC